MTPSSQSDARLGRLWWAVPAAAFLILMTLAMFFGGPERREHGTSYDASPRGFRAAYLLLDELGYPVARSRRLAGPAFHPGAEKKISGMRWLLFPTKSTEKDVALFDNWVRQGGVLLLADDGQEFARRMGISLTVQHLENDPEEEAGTGLGLGSLAGGKVRVDWPDQLGEVLVEAGGQPVVTVYRRDRGEIWLVHRPELLTNDYLKKADNGPFLCRLAETMLQKRPGQIGFDEYFHGMRDRPGVMELLLQPPALWGTCHGLFLLGILLWHFVPRFGSVLPPPRSPRRSKEEFLGAMAALLEGKRDYRAAFLPVRTAFLRELEQALGLPAGAPPERIVQEAAQRRPIDQKLFLRLLTESPGGGAQHFLKAMNELESARDEFFHQPPR